MNRGYTKRWRKRWDKGYHRDPLLWIMMDYFIDFANHCDSEVYLAGAGIIPLKRGQHVFGTAQMADFLGVDRGRIRRKLKILENINFLTIKTTSKYSIATIINYDTYNTLIDKNDQQNDQQPTNDRPSNDHQTTTPKELKELKALKKNNLSSDSDEVRLAKYLYAHIQRNNPKAKQPNLQVWAKHIEKAIRIDRRSIEDLKAVIEFSQRDPFWSANILSAAKLREKFDQLYLKMTRPQAPPARAPTPAEIAREERKAQLQFCVEMQRRENAIKERQEGADGDDNHGTGPYKRIGSGQ